MKERGSEAGLKLECVDLTKNYGKFTALNHINYTFSEGVYGLLGPNGAGKSTWMKLLTASLRQTEGAVLWNGKEIRDLKQDYVSVIGYIPQNQRLFSYFTGREFLYYMASLKGVKKHEADKQIPSLLDRVNLGSMGDKKIRTYSGGMKQRLLIVQAFLGNPQVIFMDEPTAGLDPKERIRIRNLIAEMAMDKIVLIATHVVSDIEFISKDILLMKQGEMIGNGSADEWEDRLEGMVFEKDTGEDILQQFLTTHLVAAMRKEKERIIVRYIGEKEDGAVSVRPTQDDVYLYYFREEELNDLE